MIGKFPHILPGRLPILPTPREASIEKSTLSQLSHKTHFPQDFHLSRRTCAVCLGFIFPPALWGRGSDHFAKTCLQRGGGAVACGWAFFPGVVHERSLSAPQSPGDALDMVLQKDPKYYWCRCQSKLRTQGFFFFVIFT